MAQVAKRPSLADSAEQALRDWLAPGRHRPGDRLPPEHELGAMLGVSRGTLRTALERLESSGEIVRRQGSGTFVASVPRPTALDEGLERLESYTSLARSRGVQLTLGELRIERRPLDAAGAAQFGVEPGMPATTITRLLLADGEAAATMVDTIHPNVELPTDTRLRKAMERGDMVLDVLQAQGLPVAYANTRIVPRLMSGRERTGKALGITGATAVLELQETYHLTSGEIVHFSTDIFGPGALDLHVIRSIDADVPAQVNAVGRNGRDGARRGRRKSR
ncbi:MAG TPA: GntR family transcriptional regulator [Thermoleophilaceae bacterium]|nr:GntR family transcriptional regulator [Thermoleophilaceae bacterium]